MLIIQYDEVQSQQQSFSLELDKHFKIKGRGRFSFRLKIKDCVCKIQVYFQNAHRNTASHMETITDEILR